MSDNVANLGQLSKDMIQRGLNLTAQNMISELMQRSPVDHGLLKSWAVTSQTDTEITIQSPAIYAAAQNYGSTHFIAPKNKKALFWGAYDGGKPIMSKGHEITIKPKHFVEDSIEATMPRIQEFFTINTGG